MDVLYVTHYTNLLGANRSLLQLIIELRELGVNPTVLLPPPSNNNGPTLQNELTKANIPYIEAPLRMIKHYQRWKTIANYLLALKYNHDALKKIKHHKFDLVHTNSSVITAGAYIARKMKIPHVWHLREFGDLDYDLKTPISKCFQKIIYGNRSSFIAISKAISNHYSKYIPKEKISLIYNGIKPTKATSHPITHTVNFCITGLVHHNKNQFDVIKAVNELVNNRHISNLRLNIIGGGDPSYLTMLQQYVDNHNLSPYITFWGMRNDVPQLLEQMNVGIMASNCEAFGRVTVEYMMANLAVIANDAGANREIITDGESGLIYHVGNINDLTDKMQLLIATPSLIETLSKKGYETAIEKFSSTNNSQNIFNLYYQILK